MTEGGIADRELAALALKQASGDNVEAFFYCAPTAPPCSGWR
jgi:alpha-D-ribose 1-methylphosphonate 5-triphosphate synthase subunit PhnI